MVTVFNQFGNQATFGGNLDWIKTSDKRNRVSEVKWKSNVYWHLQSPIWYLYFHFQTLNHLLISKLLFQESPASIYLAGLCTDIVFWLIPNFCNLKSSRIGNVKLPYIILGDNWGFINTLLLKRSIWISRFLPKCFRQLALRLQHIPVLIKTYCNSIVLLVCISALEEKSQCFHKELWRQI